MLTQRSMTPSTGSVVLGTWAFGGRPPDRPPIDNDECLRIIASAQAAGLTWIDTAGVYGLGSVERALASVTHSPRPARILTKCGIDWTQGDGTVSISHRSDPASIRRQVHDACERLGVETIDALLIHWPDAYGAPIEASWEQMLALRESGRVLACGLSNFSASDIRQLARLGSVDITQFSWEAPDVAALFEASFDVSATPMVYGVLKPYLSKARCDDSARAGVQQIANENGVSNAALFLALAQHRRPDAVFVLGASSPAQFESAIAGHRLMLADDQVKTLMTLLKIDGDTK